jgi:hypothetical protein
MRALIFFAAVSSCLFAQDQGQPAGKFYGPLATPWKVKLPVNSQAPLFNGLIVPKAKLIDLKRAPSKCAVPLTEMNLPPASALPMGALTPPANSAAPGGEAKLVLPPC